MNTKRFLLILLAILTAVLSACGPTDTATPAPAPDPVNVVQQYIQALNTKQLDTAMTFVADNAVYVNPYGKFEGKDRVRASLQLVINDGQ
jgi:ketosteroid isomerase-like protein